MARLAYRDTEIFAERYLEFVLNTGEINYEKYVNISFCVFKYSLDDSWLHLSEHDLEDILSRYSDPNSKLNGTECGTEGENKTKNDVSTWKTI